MNGSPDLGVKIGRLHLKNPVMPASGTFGYGEEYSKFLDFSREHNEHAIPGLKGVWGWKLKVLYLLAFVGGIGWIVRYV